ncbi:MAG: sigma-70 family RNA polymerase sigma factor [Anaerolineae bacterium]|nr:sigma-70 family RNA polymerase sigma factor [Anaerolineae bacterium]
MSVDLCDSELIAACLEGRAWAWEAIIDRYKRLVYAIPMQANLSQEDAADVFQTVFAALLRHIDRLRDAQGLAKWLITTTQRETWNVLRKRRREPTDESAFSGLSTQPTTLDSPERHTSAAIDRELLLEALRQLDQRSRKLLWMLYLDPAEPSYEQIGELMDMPLGSIGPTRARSLKKVARILKEMGMD